MDFAKAIQSEPYSSQVTTPEEALTGCNILSAKLKLTYRCNLACVFCKVGNLYPEELETSLAKQIVSDLSTRGVKKVVFSGGEVFLHKGVFDILRHSRNLGLQVNITSNGTLLSNPGLREKLLESEPSTLTVSLDAPNKKLHNRLRGSHNAFKQTVKALKGLSHKSGRPRLAVNTIIQRNTFSLLDELFDLLTEIGVDRWNLLPLDTKDKQKRLSEEQCEILAKKMDDFSSIAELSALRRADPGNLSKYFRRGDYACDMYDDFMCYAPWLQVFVEPNGFVYPCCRSRGTVRAWGNVNKDPILAILDSSEAIRTRKAFLLEQYFPICRTCPDWIKENYACASLVNIHRNNTSPKKHHNIGG